MSRATCLYRAHKSSSSLHACEGARAVGVFWVEARRRNLSRAAFVHTGETPIADGTSPASYGTLPPYSDYYGTAY
jgi:hypothetical protein